MSSKLHLVPNDGNWALKWEGAEEPASSHTTQDEALTEGRRLAAEHDVDLVIHRRDGAFRRSESPSDNHRGSRNRPEHGVSHSDVMPVFSRVSWGAIFAGAVVAFAIYTALGLFGVAIGLTAAEFEPVGGEEIAVAGAVWQSIALLVSLFIGGCVASRTTAGEDIGESMIYGLLVWAVFSTTAIHIGETGGLWSKNARRGLDSTIESSMSEGQVATLDDATERVGDVRVSLDATAAAWWSFGVLSTSLIVTVAGGLAGAGAHPSAGARRAIGMET